MDKAAAMPARESNVRNDQAQPRALTNSCLSDKKEKPLPINTTRRISVFLGVLLLSLVATHSIAGRSSEPLQPAAAPDEVARQFYRWYMQARMPAPERKNLATFRKYITRQFLKQEMDPDADAKLFVAAQDFPEPLNGVFSVSKATIRGQQATVQVILKGKKIRYKLRVTLRQENGAWKIDDVKGVRT